jgi:glycine betaine/proline transport system ATP-binding protein
MPIPVLEPVTRISDSDMDSTLAATGEHPVVGEGDHA